MKKYKKFALFLIFTMCACSPLKPSEIKPSDESDIKDNVFNIIAGVEVENGSVLSKSVALLVNVITQEICSATLIGNQYALTATHCLDKEDPGNLYIFFAAKPNPLTERRQVVATKASPSGDLALIKFEGQKLPDGYEAAIFLPRSKRIRKGTKTMVLGYGINQAQAHEGAGVLRYTTLVISDPHYSPTEVLLDQSKGTSACHGDSGGPAYFFANDFYGHPKLYLWGIAAHVSADDINNQCNKGVIYTNALVYLPWIKEVLSSL